MKRIAAGIAGLAMAAGGTLATTAPAQAQPINVGNLVNVNISNVLNNNDVDVAAQIPISVAANICGVDVDVLTSGLSDDNMTTCTSRSGLQELTITQ